MSEDANAARQVIEQHERLAKALALRELTNNIGSSLGYSRGYS